MKLDVIFLHTNLIKSSLTTTSHFLTMSFGRMNSTLRPNVSSFSSFSWLPLPAAIPPPAPYTPGLAPLSGHEGCDHGEHAGDLAWPQGQLDTRLFFFPRILLWE